VTCGIDDDTGEVFRARLAPQPEVILAWLRGPRPRRQPAAAPALGGVHRGQEAAGVAIARDVSVARQAQAAGDEHLLEGIRLAVGLLGVALQATHQMADATRRARVMPARDWARLVR